MAKKAPPPREVVAANLRALMAAQGKSSPELAKDAKLGRKTLNNYIAGRHDPHTGTLQSLAEVLGLDAAWQLLVPGLGDDAYRRDILDLMRDFMASDEVGKRAILDVARAVARAKDIGILPGEASVSRAGRARHS